MNTVSKLKPGKTDFAAIAEKLGKDFAARAEVADETDCFVADNYAALKTSGLVEAAVPTELRVFPIILSILLRDRCSARANGAGSPRGILGPSTAKVHGKCEGNPKAHHWLLSFVDLRS